MAYHKDRIGHAVSAGGTGALTLGSAVAKHRAFVVGDDARLFPYVIEDGDAWETGYGTYTHSGTSFARTTRTDSSTGSALTVTTAAKVYVTWIADLAASADSSFSGFIPGGRLTLTTGVPVTTSDVAAAGTLYYTPYKHSRIPWWNGTRWIVNTFAELSLSLTLTSGKNYDVFYTGTALALSAEWTNDTTRSDALGTQDSVGVLNSDKTKLWLGTIRASGTNVTDDSKGGTSAAVGGKRFVWNAYNQVLRPLAVHEVGVANWSYTTGSWRVANGATAPSNCIEYVTGDAATVVDCFALATAYIVNNSARSAKLGIGLDSSTVRSGLAGAAYNASGSAAYAPFSAQYTGRPSLGYHSLRWLELGADGTTTFIGDDTDTRSGLFATIMG